MFISNLNTTQQSAFLGLAKQLIESDNDISPQENILLETLHKQMDANVSAVNVSLSNLNTLFEGKKSRASMILELLGLACADDNYHPAEKEYIRKVTEACGVSENELRDMESWVVRQLALVREAAQFMED